VTGIGQQGDPEMWGNGAATARVFAQNGAKVFGCDVNHAAAQHTVERVRAEGGEITTVETDVTKKEQVQSLVQQVIDKYGRIDVLVKYFNPRSVAAMD
jgi:NAD(P)-dependent dehydrogenase (short-subunit alcohol dehydrogenase family)